MFSNPETSKYHLIGENSYCSNYVSIHDRSGHQNSTLEGCAEAMYVSKGKYGCHTTNGIFFYDKNNPEFCWCSTDDCTLRTSENDYNVYQQLDGKLCH